MYLDEDVVLDLRLNYLNNYIDKFLIVESKFTHSGEKRELNFDIKNFEKFKEKIIYLVLDHEPTDIQKINDGDDEKTKNSKYILNGMRRDFYQRNFIIDGLKESTGDDFILVSDLDEIPKLDPIDLHSIKEKFVFFRQKMFYYKFNLILENMTWCGSKSCKMKDFLSPQWLREIKDKKYPLWRIDTIFSNKKYNNVHFVENGGWHFTNIKTPEEIDKKLRSYMHHPEYDQSNIGPKEIDRMIKDRKPVYDLMANSSEAKDRSNTKLKVSDIDELPLYIRQNQDKYNEWILKK